MEDKHIKEAEKYPVLGPVYFSANEFMAKFMEDFTASDLEPMIKKFSDKFYEMAQETFETWLLANTEANIAGKIRSEVDDIVRGILGGARWALERYALQDAYDCAAVRKAVAEHIPDEIAKQRIADLEKDVARLTESLNWERRRAY